MGVLSPVEEMECTRQICQCQCQCAGIWKRRSSGLFVQYCNPDVFLLCFHIHPSNLSFLQIVCRDLGVPHYRDIDAKYRTQLIQLKTTEMATSDLEKYHKVRGTSMVDRQRSP